MAELPSIDVAEICSSLRGYDETGRDKARRTLERWVSTARVTARSEQAEREAYETLALDQARIIARLQVDLERVRARAALVGDSVEFVD